jgi:hypothetical protein
MNCHSFESVLTRGHLRRAALSLCAAIAFAITVARPAIAAEPQSPRLERAKDFIADEQWERAIEQLKAAANDPKERHRAEALYWLADSQHESGDHVGAIATISRLERDFPKSAWIRPARSLRIEIAQKLRRNDVLWWTARPPVPPAPTAVRPSTPVTPPPATTMFPPAPPTPAAVPAPIETSPATPLPPRGATPPPRAAVEAPPSPMPSGLWIPKDWHPDTNLRIQALGSLIQSDAARVIPILKEIALESPDANEAARAIFVLAQSGRPEAQLTVIEVAKHGSELVQIAAVREIGRFGGAQAPEALLQVYSIGNARVKYQVVNSLGERSATTALVRIAETERDRKLRETAIVQLGKAGAREPLVRFYARAGTEFKLAVIDGLLNARAEDELIRIADTERDVAVRAEVLRRLQLLNTAKARAYLEKHRQNR